MDAEQFLEVTSAYAAARAPGWRPHLIAVVDPSYSSGNPKVTFEGESNLSTKQYPYLNSSYTPSGGDRVVMAPVGTTYVIIGKIA